MTDNPALLIGRSLAILILISVIIYDTSYHFDRAYVEAKIDNQSAQRNWSLFYSQDQVYFNSAMRYERDFSQIRTLIKPNRTLLSDLATSYYAAAALPVYVVNIQRHQGRYTRSKWRNVMGKRYGCYLEDAEAKNEWIKFLKKQQSMVMEEHLQLNYILLNKDKENRNLRTDCLSARSGTLEVELPDISTLLYEGEFLNLYQINVL